MGTRRRLKYSRSPPGRTPGGFLLSSSTAEGGCPLGTSAKSTAAPPGEGEDGAALARLERFELQAISRQLLPQERIRYCLLRRLPHRQAVDVWYVPARRSAPYGGAATPGAGRARPPLAGHKRGAGPGGAGGARGRGGGRGGGGPPGTLQR